MNICTVTQFQWVLKFQADKTSCHIPVAIPKDHKHLRIEKVKPNIFLENVYYDGI